MCNKEFIPIAYESDEPLLICPVCHCCYVHPVGLECRSPGTANGHVRIDHRGISIDPQMPPLGRGVKITMHFTCENGHGFDYTFEFSKGNTLVIRRFFKLPKDPMLRPETIWRN